MKSKLISILFIGAIGLINITSAKKDIFDTNKNTETYPMKDCENVKGIRENCYLSDNYIRCTYKLLCIYKDKKLKKEL